MKFSRKIESCGLSPVRKFYPYEVAATAAGAKVYHLNIGQPDIETPEAYFTYDEALGLLVVKSADGNNSYYMGTYNSFETISVSISFSIRPRSCFRYFFGRIRHSSKNSASCLSSHWYMPVLSLTNLFRTSKIAL